MNVGISKITFRFPENQSLKDKRKILSSISTRVQNKFNVSIAEVEHNNSWQISTLGITCVSNSYRHAEEMLTEIISYIEESRQDLEVISDEQEIITGV